MTLDPQAIINALFSAVCVLGGWVLNDLHTKLRDTKATAEEHTKDIASLKLLVAGDYVKKEDHEKYIAAFFKKLDAIENKVDDMRHGTLTEISNIKITCAAVHGTSGKGE